MALAEAEQAESCRLGQVAIRFRPPAEVALTTFWRVTTRRKDTLVSCAAITDYARAGATRLRLHYGNGWDGDTSAAVRRNGSGLDRVHQNFEECAHVMFRFHVDDRVRRGIDLRRTGSGW
jgi:hypothetical protein